MSARLALLALASTACAFGQYTYDYAGPVTLPGSWTQNGAAPVSGPVAQYAGVGSLIWNPTVTGVNSNDYEVNTTVQIAPGGGTYVHYLRASSGALLFPGVCVGSFIAVALTVPGTYSSGGAAGAMTFYQCVSGSLSSIASTNATVLNGSTVRTVVFGTLVWVFIDDQMAAVAGIPATTGQPGIGGYGMSASSGYSKVSIGHRDTIAPSAVAPTGIRSSVLPSQVSLAWQGAQDDPNGIGTFGYNIFRNGAYLQLSPTAAIEDTTLTPGTTYTYGLESMDFHGNQGPMTSFTVTTPPATSVDPRRTGVAGTGSYWGGGGEQIDMLSGNLNFALPLVSPQGRTGWTVPVGLSYNSQNWRQDSGVNWELGTDVGYGYGWTLQIGSITPYFMAWPWGVDHYVYTDGTGAQYLLNQNSGNIWSSTQGIYVWFDANTQELHFKNGTFWLMGCVSSGAEQDAGTMYPTVIEDVGGNQVIVTYNSAIGLPGSPVNTSGRISTIEEARGNGGNSYTFSYSGTTPHLASISNSISTPESYTFTYATGVSLMPPWGYDPRFAGQTTTQLDGMGVSTTGSSYAFSYDYMGASELQKVQFPWGGYLRWTYENAYYAGSRELREINDRYMNSAATGGPEVGPYAITHSDSGGTIPIVHADATLADASGVGARKWTFNNFSGFSAWEIGLVSEFDQLPAVYASPITMDVYTWSQTPTSSNPYISSRLSSKYYVSAQTTQQVDQYGNTTQLVVYPWSNSPSPTTPVATYNSTYVTASGYMTAYLRGLLISTTVTAGSTVTPLVYNNYDNCQSQNYPTPPTFGFDGGVSSTLPYRGWVSSSVTPLGTSRECYYWWGVPYSTTSVTGVTTTAPVSSATNYALPVSISTPTYSNTLAYDSWLAMTSTTGSNGETSTMTYDSAGRPATATSPYGAVTTYAYSYGTLPAWQSATGPNGYQLTTLDGFGRPLLVQRGPNSTTIQSQTSTVYAPVACLPIGTTQEVSQPYAPGSTEYWTQYTYDGAGRPLSMVKPDGASTTSYSYFTNQTTVTDPAGNAKTFTTDVSGNLISVVEPNPAGGTFTTSYTYDWMNHLIGSSMTRGSTAQTRTFNYNAAGQLSWATNPENGTVTYTYNADTTLASKYDANGQTTTYTYDSAKRLLVEKHIMPPSGLEDPCQRITYTYDTNALNPYFSQYATGRLTTVEYGDPAATPYSTCSNHGSSENVGGGYTEMYSYHPAGGVTAKRLQVLRPWEDDLWDYWWGTGGGPYENGTLTLDVDYTYDTAGRKTSITYPMVNYPALDPALYPPYYMVQAPAPVTFTTTYDAIGRPTQLTDSFGTTWASGASYDAANRMTSVSFSSATGPTSETMGFNVNGQLTSRNWSYPWPGTSSGLSYSYSATQNNGQITQMADTISGETVAYQYDALKRLISASSTPISGSTPTAWNQTFQYDGFGNLTAKVLNGATTSISIDPTTNRQSGPGYDNNGNMLAGGSYSYDGRNRFVNTTWPYSASYFYDTQNRRVFQSLGTPAQDPGQLTLYGAYGERLATYMFVGPFVPTTGVPAQYAVTLKSFNIWFNGIDVTGAATSPYTYTAISGDTSATQDQVGTDRSQGARYRPYGEEITSTGNDRTKFGTYMRDSFTGLDYAQNRYYASSFGRFSSVDPMAASASPGNPLSWNRYSYALGDPVNGSDPQGTCTEDALDNWTDDMPGALIVDSGGYDQYSAPGLCEYDFNFLQAAQTAGSVVLNGSSWASSGDGAADPSATGSGAVTTDTITYDGDGQETVSGVQTFDQDPLAGVLSGYSSIDSFSYAWSLGPLGALIGSAFGPEGTAAGAFIGSFCAFGFNYSYVPSTWTSYFGPVVACSPVPGGASGWLFSGTLVPSGQDPNSIAGGRSGSITILRANPGTTITRSPGSGPPVVGVGIGTRTPVSVGVGYNGCFKNCPRPQ